MKYQILSLVLLAATSTVLAQSPYDNIVDKPDKPAPVVVDEGPQIKLQNFDGIPNVEAVAYLGGGKYLVRIFTNVRATILNRTVVIPQCDYLVLTVEQYERIKERQ